MAQSMESTYSAAQKYVKCKISPFRYFGNFYILAQIY